MLLLLLCVKFLCHSFILKVNTLAAIAPAVSQSPIISVSCEIDVYGGHGKDVM